MISFRHKPVSHSKAFRVLWDEIIRWLALPFSITYSQLFHLGSDVPQEERSDRQYGNPAIPPGQVCKTFHGPIHKSMPKANVKQKDSVGSVINQEIEVNP